MEYLKLILPFLAGGGLQYFINWKTNRKKENLSYAEKAVNFWEEYASTLQAKYEMLLIKVSKLEADVDKLTNLRCENTDCKDRQ